MGIDLGFTNLDIVSKNIYSDTKLVVVREQNNKTNKETLKSKVASAILQYFTPANVKLGQTIDISKLSSDILSIPGVKNIRTVNSKENVYFNGLSLVMWNPMFENVDETVINQTTTLPFFKFPYIYRPNTLINRIEVIDE